MAGIDSSATLPKVKRRYIDSYPPATWNAPEAGIFANTQGETAPSADTKRARSAFLHTDPVSLCRGDQTVMDTEPCSYSIPYQLIQLRFQFLVFTLILRYEAILRSFLFGTKSNVLMITCCIPIPASTGTILPISGRCERSSR